MESFSYKLQAVKWLPEISVHGWFILREKVVSVLDFLSLKLSGFGDNVGKGFTVGVVIQSYCKCISSYLSGTAKSFLTRTGPQEYPAGLQMPDQNLTVNSLAFSQLFSASVCRQKGWRFIITTCTSILQVMQVSIEFSFLEHLFELVIWFQDFVPFLERKDPDRIFPKIMNGVNWRENPDWIFFQKPELESVGAKIRTGFFPESRMGSVGGKTQTGFFSQRPEWSWLEGKTRFDFFS